MKYVLSMVAILTCALFVLAAPSHHPPSLSEQGTPATEDHKAAMVPVVVELFTSEGCSSCPPADAFLAKLEREQPIPNAQIVAIEEHVDYWNDLGWMDPFSAKEWSLRQEEYATSFGNRGVYTPQIVVDGRTELVGSRADQARKTIESEAMRAKAQVSVSPKPGSKAQEEEITVSVGALPAGDAPEVWLAITEAGLHSNVTRGENAGEDLHHASVLRTLRKIGVADANKEVSFSKQITVPLDSSWNRGNLRTVVFVQGKKSHQILGAGIAFIEK
jgi:hypothetical protein